MKKGKRKAAKAIQMQGLILPKDGASLKELWRAFAKGGTWSRIGRRRSKRARFRHAAYKGDLRLEQWGRAIRCVVNDGDGSGKICGAFLGHAERHGAPLIDRIDLRFS